MYVKFQHLEVFCVEFRNIGKHFQCTLDLESISIVINVQDN